MEVLIIMTEEEKKICKTIYDFIYTDLHKQEIDIFSVNSLEDLGELFYLKILTNIPSSTQTLIFAVLRSIAKENIPISDVKRYYLLLTRVLFFKQIPAVVLRQLQAKYDDIFINEIHRVTAKYNARISSINTDLQNLSVKRKKLLSQATNKRFLNDIAPLELEFLKYEHRCNELRTQKESLAFSFKFVESQFSSFLGSCDERVALKLKAKSISQEPEYFDLSGDISSISTLFSPYETYIEVLNDELDRPYATFYKIKICTFKNRELHEYILNKLKKNNSQAELICMENLKKIPKIDDLYSAKMNDQDSYLQLLSSLDENFNFLVTLETLINESVTLRSRNHLLLKCIEFYRNQEFTSLNCILPIQIEGIFLDLLNDSTIFSRLSNFYMITNAVLKEKISYLYANDYGIYAEVAQYFMVRFNNTIRNKVAHGEHIGDLNSTTDNIFSLELLLDLFALVDMLTAISETEKMTRYIKSHTSKLSQCLNSSKDEYYSFLFNDLAGDKITSFQTSAEQYTPLQIVYWIVNPYYESVYSKINSREKLLEIRSILFSIEFWEYVLETLTDPLTKDAYSRLHYGTLSVVNGLFKCEISSETKSILGKVQKEVTSIINQSNL